MTLEELRLIKRVMPDSLCIIKDCNTCKDIKKVNEILDREIKLKTTNFVTNRIIGERDVET